MVNEESDAVRAAIDFMTVGDKYINKGMKSENIVKIMKQIADDWENGRWTRADIIKDIFNV